VEERGVRPTGLCQGGVMSDSSVVAWRGQRPSRQTLAHRKFSFFPESIRFSSQNTQFGGRVKVSNFEAF